MSASIDVVMARLKSALTDNGYADRIGKSFPERPGMHNEGLPNKPFIRLGPDYSPIDGLCTVLVTPTKVEQWVLRQPYLHNDWRCAQQVHYSTQNELFVNIQQFVKVSAGCWD